MSFGIQKDFIFLHKGNYKGKQYYSPAIDICEMGLQGKSGQAEKWIAFQLTPPLTASQVYTLKTNSQHAKFWIPIHEFPDEQANHEIKCKQVNLANVYSKIFLSLLLIPLDNCGTYHCAVTHIS